MDALVVMRRMLNLSNLIQPTLATANHLHRSRGACEPLPQMIECSVRLALDPAVELMAQHEIFAPLPRSDP